jgi:Dyp-type peroxidase family
MAAREPVLAVDQIQGSVLPGFRTGYQTLVGLAIGDAGAARAWCGAAAGRLATAAELLAVDRRRRAPPRRERGPWLNLGLSYAGLTRLSSSVFRFADEAFRAGLAARSFLLGDPTDPKAAGHRDGWVVGAPGREPDLLLIVGGGTREAVEARAEEIGAGAERSGLRRLWQETGARIGDSGSLEHFGFHDGISQPALRGRLPADGTPFLTPRRPSRQPPPDGPAYAGPGAPLVWPGSFVFGYPAQSPLHARDPGPVAAAGPPWTRNGSLLVFRRLRQHVGRFAAFLAEQAPTLAKQGLPVDGPEQLAAMLVGRWRSGAPIVRSPQRDDPELGAHRAAANHFDFANRLPRDGFPAGQVDPLGLVCPNSAHIRKVNPRGGYTEQGGLEDTLTRRVLRRGIPYGRPVADPASPAPEELDEDRGLHFLCYQTSITGQFEFLQRDWSNSPTGPRGGGLDLLTGQQGERPRACWLPTAAGRPVALEAAERFVVPTGGGYFFVPSVAGLRELVDGG